MQPRVQDLGKFSLPPNFRGRSVWFVQLWWIVQSTLFHCSPQFMYGWRNFLLRLFGARIGKGVIVRPTAEITYPWKLTIGDHVWIGDHVTLYTLGEIYIGDNACVSQYSYICAAAHDYLKPTFDIFACTVVIKPVVWLATHVFVAPGVTVGRGAVVGACSVVTKDVPPMTISAGNPARVLRPRPTDTNEDMLSSVGQQSR